MGSVRTTTVTRMCFTRRGVIAAVAAAVALLEGGASDARAAAWKSYGPEGAVVRALAASSATPQTLYVGTLSGGVFKSTDGGDTWSPANGGIAHGWITELAVDPTTATTVYAGVTLEGLYKTTDGGASWSAIGFPFESVYGIAIQETAPNVVYAAVGGSGVLKSTDGGEHWTAINNGLGAVIATDVVIDPSNPLVLYAGTLDGIFKSTDGGNNWTAASIGLPDLATGWLRIDPSMPSTLYANVLDKLFRSTDGASTWTQVDTAPLLTCPTALAIDPTDSAKLYMASLCYANLIRSTDGGATWFPANGALDGAVHAVVVDPTDPDRVYAGDNNRGISVSINGGANFTSSNAGLTATRVVSLDVDPSAPFTVYAGVSALGSVLKSTDGGTTWDERRTDENPLVVVDPQTPTTVYAVGNGLLSKTTDAGNHWTYTASLPTSTLRGIAIDPSDTTTLYGATMGGVFKSTDAGDTWSLISIGMTDPVERVLVDPQTPSTLYATRTVSANPVIKSTDSGVTWSPADSGLAPASANGLFFDPSAPATLYAATWTGVYKTTDGGASWVLSSSGLTNLLVAAVAVDPVTPTIVYAGTQGGVFQSLDGGANWSAFGSGLTNPAVMALAIDRLVPTTVYAATDGGGVFVYRVCGDGTVDAGETCDEGAAANGAVSCCSLICQTRPAAYACRPSNGACDSAEVCDGSDPACPAQVLSGPSVECRPSAGDCDVAENCTGSSAACPADALQPAGTVCRPAVDACDQEEHCNGSSSTCPSNALMPNGTPCEEDGDPCTPPRCQSGTCVQLDSDGDGIGDRCDNCATTANIDQVNTDCPDPGFFFTGDCILSSPDLPGCCDGGDACDVCPAFADNPAACAAGSVSFVAGPSGGNGSTPDGSASMIVPPGALLAPTSLSLTQNTDASAGFALAGTSVASFSAGPPGVVFLSPVELTIRWNDRDEDGLVDIGACIGGADANESCDSDGDCASASCTIHSSSTSQLDLELKRNGVRFGADGFSAGPYACSDLLSGACETAVADCSDAPGTGTATIARCCDPVNHEWTFQTCSFSEFFVGLRAGDLVPGRGPKTSDCHAEWNPHNPRNRPYLDARGVPNFAQTCTDGDPVCDHDNTVNGVCSYQVALSFNVDDPRLRSRAGLQLCHPLGVGVWSVVRPKPDSHNSDDAANATRLLNAVRAMAPNVVSGVHGEVVTFDSPLSGERDSAQVEVQVPLQGPAHDRPGVKVIRMRSTTVPPPGETAGIRDVDTLKLRCLPAP